MSSSPTLLVDISDSSGVNTSGAGIGHRLEAWIDSRPASVDLGVYYRSNPDTYASGVVSYPLGPLAAGSHSVRVRAWDTYNNSSTSEAVFSVGGSGGLEISNVYNYPNPFARSTWFTFEHNQTAPVDVEVRIYTVAGRMIHSLPAYAVDDRLVKIAWQMKSKVSRASGRALPSPDRRCARGDDDCERDGAAAETTDALPAVTTKQSSTQKRGSLRPSSETKASCLAVRMGLCALNYRSSGNCITRISPAERRPWRVSPSVPRPRANTLMRHSPA